MSFGVTVDFDANVAKFTKQVDRISGDLDRFQKKVDKTSAFVTKAFAAVGVGLGAVSFAKSINDVANYEDRLQKLSIRLGATVEGLSQLDYVAQLSGVSFETITTSLQRGTRRIAEAANGTGEAVGALNELNLSAQHLKQLKPEQQFEIIAEAISQVKEPADRVRIAMKLFDTEGVALLQTMENGALGIKKMRKEFDEFGGTISKQAADDMAKYNDAIAGVDNRLNAMSRIISEKVAPSVTYLATLFNDFYDRNFSDSIDAQIDEINEKIVSQRRKINALNRDGAVGGFIDDILGYDINKEKNKLDTLLKQRQILIRDSISKVPDFTDAADIIIGNIQASGQNAKPTAARSTRSVATTNPVLERQQRQWDQLIADANEYYDLRQEIDAFENNAVIYLSGFEQQLARIDDLVSNGIIDETQAKTQFDRIGAAFNNLYAGDISEKFGEDMNKMSVYAEQGARNAQDVMADFLFDPVNEGFDGMLLGFVNVVRRMAAEAAAAHIAEALFGKINKSGGRDGGLISAAFSAIGAAIFHDGGTVGDPAPRRMVNPFLFANAQRYHDGGIAGLKPGEVPAILQKGEVVSPVSKVTTSAGAQINISTSVSVSGGGNNDQGNAKALGRQINAAIRKTLVEELRPGGLLA